MKLLRAITVLIFTLACASCVTWSPDVTRPEEILSDEGLILVSIHSDSMGLLTVHHGPMSVPYAGFAIDPGKPLRLVRVTAASDLRISTYQVGGKRAYFDNTKFNFDVHPGTITYIGDIYVSVYGRAVDLKMADREAETLEQAKHLFPSIFAKFKYEKHLLRDKRLDAAG